MPRHARAIDALRLLQARNPGALQAQHDASYDGTAVARRMQMAAQLIRADLGCEVIAIDIGGWDTHVNQNAALHNRLTDLARGLAAFMTDMGTGMAA